MLKGKVALVTGSTSGIGLGIAHALAAQGAHLLINGFGEAAAIEALRAGIAEKYGVRCLYSPADMRQPAQIREMVAVAETQLGAADILVNNAGIQFTGRTETFPDDKWDDILAINLSSAFHATKAALPGMQQRDFGRIVNIASVHGLVASKEKLPYVAAKHGLVGMTKVVALENATANITCNAICPGWVLTPLVQKQIDDRAARQGITAEAATHDMLAEKQPSQRFATPEEIGATVVFLCGAAGRAITGICLPVDGGWTAQ
ncbi:MAG: 3-hydroxybutyrate dehydrogenase [Alphaproteobacteria bacterium]|nr:3-hydroxybutyrate dehydrogenase [Alphaproteobacteria bacterium]